MKHRKISDAFFNQLTFGILRPLLDAVHEDDTLCMELRGDAVNIYYRGGSLFRIEEKADGFTLSFDTKYCDARSRPSQILCKPSLWCRIEAAQWRFSL